MNEIMNKKDELVMRLVHYFVTEEDYQPIIVNGVKNEIWLENLDAPYKVIRINSNYIHNKEQLKFDNFKIKNIVKQIKKKTFSFKMKTLNILLDLNEDVEIYDSKYIDNFKVKSLKDVRKDDNLAGLFPKLKTLTLKQEDDFAMIINLTNDINEKNEKINREYERVFKPKKIILTNLLIYINIIMFVLSFVIGGFFENFILIPERVKDMELYRLFTAGFMHLNLFHLLVNMYSLKILGEQVETYFGKKKFLVIYFFSMLTASLFASIGGASGLGASGAIFGLMGALLYFGYNFRLYFGSVLVKQLSSVIIMNLLIGFLFNGISNAAHIGGLIGGLFITLGLGVNDKDKHNRINGFIVSTIYLIFLIYVIFFR